MFVMRCLRLAALLALAACAPRTPVATTATSANDGPPVVILISIDGFRADYVDRPGAVNLRALAARGVRAERMIPSFPAITFPNQYTLVTGLYPGHHGIVVNNMSDSVLGRFALGDNPAVRDGRWWGGEPIWVTAEQQGQRSAMFFWPGSEAAIKGVRPHWYNKYDGSVPNSARVTQVLNWLSLPLDSAPRFIGVYFSDTDDMGHKFGPDSPENAAAIAHADSAVGAILHGIDSLRLTQRVNVIVVADHGMTELAPDRLIPLDEYVSPDSVTILELNPMAAIFPKPGAESYVYNALKGRDPHLTVYKKGELPARLQYREHPRVAPIIALADAGWTIVRTRASSRVKPGSLMGMHGYDNELASMGAVFVAGGPAFRQGLRVGPFANIHVYPLMTHILGLRAAPNDGSLSAVQGMLRR